MSTYDFSFKKKYGQNFLKDEQVLTKIANSAEIQDNALTIEVGPGAGALTQKLCMLSHQVLAYEIDTSLEEILDHYLREYDNLDIIYDDFLNRDLKKDLEPYMYDHLYFVSNLPYYITTPIIMKLIEEKIPIERIVIMIQKEVGDRFSAKPGSKDYGSLTVFLNYYFSIQKLFIVNRNCFVPKPNVDSIVVSMTRKEHLLELKDTEHFFQLVRDSFRFKRKTLRNNLKEYDLSIIEQVLKQHHLDLSIRAEQLPLEIFVEMSNSLHS